MRYPVSRSNVFYHADPAGFGSDFWQWGRTNQRLQIQRLIPVILSYFIFRTFEMVKHG